MAKKTQIEIIFKQFTEEFHPDEILHELSKVYKRKYNNSSNSEQSEYWEKCYRACENLSSGMSKWVEEGEDGT